MSLRPGKKLQNVLLLRAARRRRRRCPADGTQFFITHFKKTMEAAQSMYGVTMQEPGVSTLVSVEFQHAAA